MKNSVYIYERTFQEGDMKVLVFVLMLFGVIAFLLKTNSVLQLFIAFVQYILPLIVGTLWIYSLLLFIKYKKEGV